MRAVGQKSKRAGNCDKDETKRQKTEEFPEYDIQFKICGEVETVRVTEDVATDAIMSFGDTGFTDSEFEKRIVDRRVEEIAMSALNEMTEKGTIICDKKEKYHLIGENTTKEMLEGCKLENLRTFCRSNHIVHSVPKSMVIDNILKFAKQK